MEKRLDLLSREEAYILARIRMAVTVNLIALAGNDDDELIDFLTERFSAFHFQHPGFRLSTSAVTAKTFRLFFR